MCEHLARIVVEILKNEKSGISRFAVNEQDRFLCQLNFINEFRLMIKDKNEKSLYLDIMRLLDKSFLIVRSDKARLNEPGSKINLEKLDINKIKIKRNDSVYPKYFQYSGIFSKDRRRSTDNRKPVNDRLFKFGKFLDQ